MTRRPERGRPWLRTLVGALVAGAGLVMLVQSAGQWRDREAYRRAPVCQDGPADGCVVAATAFVERKHLASFRRTDTYTVWLWHPRPELVREPEEGVELPEPDAVWNALRDDGEVGVRIWRRNVTRIDVAGRVAETEHSPLTGGVERTAVAVVALFLGMTAALHGVAAARRVGWGRVERMPPTDVTHPVARLLVAATGASVVPLFVVASLDVYSPYVFLLLPGAGVPLWLLLGRVRPRT